MITHKKAKVIDEIRECDSFRNPFSKKPGSKPNTLSVTIGQQGFFEERLQPRYGVSEIQ